MLGYIEKTVKSLRNEHLPSWLALLNLYCGVGLQGDRAQLLPVLAQLLQFSEVCPTNWIWQRLATHVLTTRP